MKRSKQTIKYKTLYEEYKGYCKARDIKLPGSYSDFRLYIQYAEEAMKGCLGNENPTNNN